MKKLIIGLVFLTASVFAQPPGESFPPGTSITLTATSDGNPAPTFQWFKDSVKVADGATLTLTTGPETIGSYSVKATNTIGSATSPQYVMSLQTSPNKVSITVTVNVVVQDQSRPPLATSGTGAPVPFTTKKE